MNLIPGPYLWRMKSEDDYHVVEVFQVTNRIAMFYMVGSNCAHSTSKGDEFVRLVPAEEVEKAFTEGWNSCACSTDNECEHDAFYATSRTRRVANGEEQ